MIDKVILERKGAKRPLEVPEKIVELLNSGILETVNLSEWLGRSSSSIYECISRFEVGGTPKGSG